MSKAAKKSKGKRKNNESDSEEDMDMIDVDFEWFDPQQIDFLGIKSLLRQLLDVDAQLFNLSELADLVLSQPLLGSTVKTDGNESDPWAFLTVINLSTHKDMQVIKDLTAYLTRHASVRSLAVVQSVLSSNSAQVGLILTDRVLNIPHEVVPPMYTMLLEEIEWALEAKEPYVFTHYLVLSKTYVEIASDLTNDLQPPNKKKKGGQEAEVETMYFHPEDEVLHRHALAHGNFEYETPRDDGASDSKRAFQELGVKQVGHLILIEADKFKGAVDAVKGFLGGGQ